MSATNHAGNPYVGPRTFSEAESHLCFGRDREARDLLGRVLSERLLLFYAPSGAGKSSLINTRLIPQIRQAGYAVLPVARVSGELPDGVTAVDNIYAFSLMASLDTSSHDPSRFAQVTLSQFLAGLTSNDGVHFCYDESAALDAEEGHGGTAATLPYLLVIDQFEEVITSHPDRWQEREGFFRQLNQALLDDPNLWVVLALREEYVAALDPYAELTFNRLRARFYMERMGQAAALLAIGRPAEVGGRPFAPGVAEKLVDDLLQVRVPGQEKTVAGQHVEPVQLQVVCYQLWEKLHQDRLRPGTDETGESITMDDLRQAGDVNQALIQFYRQTLADALGEAEVQDAGVTERALRTWFGEELITETGIRDTILRNEASGRTGSMPNVAVDRLASHRLLRIEPRAGGRWVELVHDRLVGPIRDANQAWFREHDSPLTRAAQAWLDADSDPALLYSGTLLKAAQEQLDARPSDYGALETRFLTASQDARRTRRRRRQLAVAFAVTLIVVFGVMAGIATYGWGEVGKAEATAETVLQYFAEAQMAAKTAEAQMTAGAASGDEEAKAAAEAAKEAAEAARETAEAAYATKIAGTLATNEAKPDASKTTQVRPTEPGSTSTPPTSTLEPQSTPSPTPTPSPALTVTALAKELADTQAMLTRVAPGWGSTRVREIDGAVMVYVPAGQFWMGSTDQDIDAVLAECTDCRRDQFAGEQPPHKVSVDAFWIDKTEVTNAQYKECVEKGECHLPQQAYSDTRRPSYYGNPDYDDYPVIWVTWDQAKEYAEWVDGWLCTEAEWEYAARGPDGYVYPWGKEWDAGRCNTKESNTGDTTKVDSCPAGASWCGALDMAGNVWEWVADWYDEDYYANSPAESPQGPRLGDDRVARGGSWGRSQAFARSAARDHYPPNVAALDRGFRVCFPISP